MVWRVIGALAFIITGAQVLAVRRMLARPDRSRRRGDQRGDEAISRWLPASPGRDRSALILWPDGLVVTPSAAPTAASSVAPGREAAGNISRSTSSTTRPSPH